MDHKNIILRSIVLCHVKLILEDYRSVCKRRCNIKDLRTATMSVVCFLGLLRVKELLNFRVCDKPYMMITSRSMFLTARQTFIEKVKMSLFRGQTLVHVQRLYWSDIFRVQV